jgi:pimeloyl-ACP methyl ester carboxylesterase
VANQGVAVGATREATADGFVLNRTVGSDGTPIEYRTIGMGPGVVVLHGAMESAGSHSELARALANDFTVHLVERRGHRSPAPSAATYRMADEVDDVAVVLAATGARDVMGVSAGGLIALEAALRPGLVRRVVAYEPALLDDASTTAQLVRRLDVELADGRLDRALVTGMLGGQMGPAFLRRIPRSLLEAMVRSSFRKEAKTAKARPANAPTMAGLAPTLRYDFALVDEEAGHADRFAGIATGTLLLGGSKSPAYLRHALDRLERIVPGAKRVEFAGLDHGGSSDRSDFNRSGNPALVADAIRTFLVGGGDAG